MLVEVEEELISPVVVEVDVEFEVVEEEFVSAGDCPRCWPDER